MTRSLPVIALMLSMAVSTSTNAQNCALNLHDGAKSTLSIQTFSTPMFVSAPSISAGLFSSRAKRKTDLKLANAPSRSSSCTRAIARLVCRPLLSLIHISEPTRPY